MNTPRQSQLDWVHRNRQPWSRTEGIGSMASRLLDPKFERTVWHREEVWDCIGRVVDDTFRACCTLGKVDDRSVEIIVNHPTAASALRRQWLMYLLEHLDRNCRFKISPEIRFRAGEAGDRFGPVVASEGLVEGGESTGEVTQS